MLVFTIIGLVNMDNHSHQHSHENTPMNPMIIQQNFPLERS